ncbi:hypothetical protein [Clostridium saccharobutylicum]|uniref:Head decoration protein n=1 Tax=Clostridium saccharobutylicum DSM 13864 TaxID=1345695 RepID=U5MTQ9_CLOSA|nr:hypothetical protein [Clostridium saccharobutylicum]AGX43960.1 hypothetical protein CLSA_c29930 [Clostridium saccharobutylicum DSM 13864]AQR91257.1 hypothetical protein CLOSC_29810 [Clostridium saccharobutylicum]AQS01161.1 hypothetical protein CSACC_29880 [Clostridium saccharobutylicum]AQS10574.1 hypothetical protein CLOBY_27190 [Clostridium saccharobutylicum]AQS15144.1 hypothetical protein CLOSACC_29880 [Clostridium saccharobutylicum]
MNFTRTTYDNDMEILYSNANLVTFSGTVLAANVTEADEHGKKYVASGSLIDKDGNVVKQTGATGSETLSSTPASILYKTVDVTNGDEACSLIVEGYLRADRVLDGFSDKVVAAIKTALPNIKFI